MRKLIATLILALGLSTPSYADKATDTTRWACEWLQETGRIDESIKCKKYPNPIIVLSRAVDDMRSYSGGVFDAFVYQGEPYIFIDPHFEEEYTTELIVHETIHYILYREVEDITRCDNEELAWQAEAAWANKPYDTAWRQWYGCAGQITVTYNQDNQ